MSDINHLLIPRDAVTALVADVAAYGAQDVETGAFLLTQRGCNDVSVLALLGTEGVVRHRGRLEVSATVMDPLFTFAEDRDLQVRAQVHSHKGDAFLSLVDRRGNIRVPGFTAAVIPTYRTPPAEPQRWGWWTYRTPDWTKSLPGLTTEDSAHVITVDAGGVRDH